MTVEHNATKCKATHSVWYDLFRERKPFCIYAVIVRGLSTRRTHYAVEVKHVEQKHHSMLREGQPAKGLVQQT